MASELLWRTLQKDPPRDFAIVEGEPVGTDDLGRLVTFARYHHGITACGPTQGGADRLATVRLGRIPAGVGAGLARAGDDLVDDRLGPFRARVVGGHPDPVREAGGDPPPDRALAPNAVAAAAPDDAPPPPREPARGGPHALPRAGKPTPLLPTPTKIASRPLHSQKK